LEGIDSCISKTATIVRADEDLKIEVFKPLDFFTEPVMKLAIEPLNPSELPKMLEGLRKINKSYPIIRTKVEESGEHVLYGTGELQMDSVMSDLRNLYAEVEVKVSEPFCTFVETVSDTSSVKCQT
jgi:U5 small nuclear ribonucleoprotein component